MVQDLGGYRLIEELGSGGMGVVYLGVDGGNNPVAVKVLHPHIANDETARKRLAREVRTLRRIRHPRIAEVLDAELDSAQPFIITEFVDGQTLSDDVKENGPFAEDELVHFGHALLDALNAVHESGVVHRDLKPANVMIMDGEPMVIDFGIAQVADEVRVTATGLVMGTPGYLSPEIADGKTSSEKTDWWGWAATMAFAATGRNPYGSGPLEAVLGRVAMGKFDLDGAPRNFVPLLKAALDPKPERRPSGQMILDALVDIESGRMPQLGSGSAAAGAAGAGAGQRTPNGTAVMPAVDDDGSAYGAAGHGVLRGDYPGGTPIPGGPGSYPPVQNGLGSQGRSSGRSPGAPMNQGTAPPVHNPNGGIQAAPGSPLAQSNLGGAAYRGSGQPGPMQSGYGQPGPMQSGYGQPGPMSTGYGQPGPDRNGAGYPGSGYPGHGQGSTGFGQGGAGMSQGGVGLGQDGQLAGPTAGPHAGQPDQFGPGNQPGYGWGPMTYRTVRTGGWVVFGLILLAITLMPLGPLVICAVAFCWSVLARTGTRLDRKMQKHRFERGNDGGGLLRSFASAPGAVLASVLTSIASFILPAVAGVAMLVLMRLDIAGIVPEGLSEQWSVWVAGAAGALVLWVGPGAASLRFGSRLIVSGATRNQLGRLIALAVIALLITIGIVLIESGAAMTWWPLPESPFTYLPGPV